MRTREFIILALEEQINEVFGLEDLSQIFPSVPLGKVDSETRIKLYAHLLGIFYEEAESLEHLVSESTADDSKLCALDNIIVSKLAEVTEDEITNLAEIWNECLDLGERLSEEEANVETLSDALFKLIHASVLSKQETVLSVFIYSR